MVSDTHSNSVLFHDTRVAFVSRDDDELERQYRLFGLLRFKWVVNVGSKLTFTALRLHLPITGLIRKTIFRQFCAAENLEDSLSVVISLRNNNIGSILDYSVEGKGTEDDFENVKRELFGVIQVAGLTALIPYTCLKLTAIMPVAVLENISSSPVADQMRSAEAIRAKQRFENICNEAALNKVPLYIDAEESWLQEGIDRLTEEMMWKHNENEAIICTTIQMYRKDRLAYLIDLIAEARRRKKYLGIKLVRGAYMEKEARRAASLNLSSPINDSKEITDECYDKALGICLQNLDIVSLCIGTHNEESTIYATELMKQLQVASNDKRVYFSQLYGMSDNITYNLAAHGYNAIKYVPYGPIRSVLPYLVRRAEENTAISGQMGRELANIQREIIRRRDAKNQKIISRQ